MAEQKQYQIGNYQFETEDEMRRANQDVEYMKGFIQQLDLSKPKVAKQLYERLNQTDSLLQTKLGEDFKESLVQTFVRHTIVSNTENLNHVKNRLLISKIRESTYEKMLSLYHSSLIIIGIYLILTLLVYISKLNVLQEFVGRTLVTIWGTLTYFLAYFLIAVIGILLIQMLIQLFNMIRNQKISNHRISSLLFIGGGLLGGLFVVCLLRERIQIVAYTYTSFLNMIRTYTEYHELIQSILNVL